jgi:hypothetical protein
MSLQDERKGIALADHVTASQPVQWGRESWTWGLQASITVRLCLGSVRTGGGVSAVAAAVLVTCDAGLGSGWRLTLSSRMWGSPALEAPPRGPGWRAVYFERVLTTGRPDGQAPLGAQVGAACRSSFITLSRP